MKATLQGSTNTINLLRSPESLDIGQHCNTSLDGNEKIESAQQFLESLNTVTERAECERTLASDEIRKVYIPGLDEEAHETLWKHQATLEKLNANLNAERIKRGS